MGGPDRMCHWSTSTLENSCGCTALDTTEWREMTVEIDWRAKQPSQAACVPEDLKYWRAWDTSCGHKAKDITPSTAWRREAGKEEALSDLSWITSFQILCTNSFMKEWREGKYKSPFLSTVETVLNGIGLSGMWTHKFDLNYSNQWFKSKVTRVLRDQYIQQGSSETESKEIYYNYRMFKNVFTPEDYL